jgi:hypothetical protein
MTLSGFAIPGYLTPNKPPKISCRILLGGMAEWTIAAVLKTVEHREVLRGFESHSLRQNSLSKAKVNRLNVVIKAGSGC